MVGVWEGGGAERAPEDVLQSSALSRRALPNLGAGIRRELFTDGALFPASPAPYPLQPPPVLPRPGSDSRGACFGRVVEHCYEQRGQFVENSCL